MGHCSESGNRAESPKLAIQQGKVRSARSSLKTTISGSLEMSPPPPSIMTSKPFLGQADKEEARKGTIFIGRAHALLACKSSQVQSPETKRILEKQRDFCLRS